MTWNMIVLIASVLIVANIYASIRCLISPLSDPAQKIYQLVFIWLIPIMGAALAIHFTKINISGADYKTTDADPASPQKVSPGDFSSGSGDGASD